MSLLHAHLVFVTKYRRKVSDNAMLADAEDIMPATCAALGAELVEFNGEADHVHLLIDYPPTLAIADLVRRLKGASARRLRADHTGPLQPRPDARPLLDALPLRGLQRRRTTGDHQAVHRKPSQTPQKASRAPHETPLTPD